MAFNWAQGGVQKGQYGYNLQNRLQNHPNMQTNNPTRYNNISSRLNNMRANGQYGQYTPQSLQGAAAKGNFGQLWGMQQNSTNQNTQQNLAINRPDQTNALGSNQWSFDPKTGQYTNNVQLNQGQQNLFNQAQTGAGKFQGNINNTDYSNQAVGNNIMDQWDRRNAPMWDKNQKDLEQSMYNRGIAPGTDSWNQQEGQFNQDKNNAYLDTQTQASKLSDQFATSQMGRDVQGYQAGLQGMNQIGNPTFQQFNQQQVANPDIYNNAMNYNQTMWNRKHPSGGGGGGGGGGFQYPSLPPNLSGNSQPNPWGQIGMGLVNSLGGSLANSAGQGIGNAVGNWWNSPSSAPPTFDNSTAASNFGNWGVPNVYPTGSYDTADTIGSGVMAP